MSGYSVEITRTVVCTDDDDVVVERSDGFLVVKSDGPRLLLLPAQARLVARAILELADEMEPVVAALPDRPLRAKDRVLVRDDRGGQFAHLAGVAGSVTTIAPDNPEWAWKVEVLLDKPLSSLVYGQHADFERIAA
ncbi:MAG: hypothetical protein ACAH27_05555 [Xanthobacteraceae bacterium]